MQEIIIEGPGKNALGTELMQSLLAQLRQAAGQPVLLRGGGDVFSAGLNLKEVAALDARGMEDFLTILEELVEALYCYPGPTVALVNGHAIAGGCILVLACDQRVAVDNPRCKIGLNEVALGLRFSPRLLRVVRQRLAPAAAEDVLLGGALHPPSRALQLGLVDMVVDNAEEMARACLASLARHPPAAYAALKQELRGQRLHIEPAEQSRFIRDSLPAWCAPELKERLRTLLK